MAGKGVADDADDRHSLPLHRRASDLLQARAQQHLLRERRVLRSQSPVHLVDSRGQSFLNFSSNDYLGLTRHPRVVQAVGQAAIDYGAGSGAAALVTGYAPIHQQCEQAIARWKGVEASVLFPSGYQANLAAVQTLASIGGRVRFLIDKLVHASLVDAVRGLSDSFRVFPHNDLAKLQRLLEKAEADELQVVVTESIFSMDGDSADLVALAKLKERFRFVLLLDEAHGTGVYGDCGQGYAAECGVPHVADVSIVTFSKALGLGGAAVCCAQVVSDALVNVARAAIYSTSVPPPVAGGVLAAIEVIQSDPDARAILRTRAHAVREALAEMGIAVSAGDSPIIPIIVGDEKRAIDLSAQLAGKGLIVPAIRPPTVPPGTSRLRVTLSTAHSDDEIQMLIQSLREAMIPM